MGRQRIQKRVALIATVLNEEDSVGALLESILQQTRQPDEVVLVDGGSSDTTVSIVQSYSERLPLRLIEAPGANISQGRNLAITSTDCEIIAATDAGVRLSPTWLESLLKPFHDHNDSPLLVACGFFVPDARTVFELAMGATVIPNVRDIDGQRFLPSSRSVAFSKEAWRVAGGYPAWLDYCEDLVFDTRLKEAGVPFVWCPEALVYFRPRNDLKSFFKQYYRYARGDGKANLWTKRHLIRYLSYGYALSTVAFGLCWKALWPVLLLGGAVHLYRPYARLLPYLRQASRKEQISALSWVPVIRLTGDIAKMAGYPVGLIWRWKYRKTLKAQER
ncbi:MAG: glycosyltransferase [Dehalococcoidia bacterium]|nr:glycosyltransferase [Dehalococcoidia bacterium]